MSPVQGQCGSNLAKKLQHKWCIAEIKVMLLQVAHALLEDDVYTREEAAQELTDVVQRLEVEERLINVGSYPVDMKHEEKD